MTAPNDWRLSAPAPESDTSAASRAYHGLVARNGKDPTPRSGARSGVRRAMENALDATKSRAGQAAWGLSNASIQEYLEELEPYLVEETVPRIIDGVTPLLIERTVPQVVDGVTAHITEVTVPAVIAGVTPELVDSLLPRILKDLQPYLEREIVPGVLDSVTPKIESETVPAILDALMPQIQNELAPQIVDALMPKITEQVAPQLVDSLMPKIHADVVPAVLDDIVDDPRVRTLIREQSQGLFLDALERFGRGVARADSFAENIGRRLFGQRPRPVPVGSDPPLPPGRQQIYAGAVSRGLAFLVDMILTTSVVAVGLNTVLGLTAGLSQDGYKASGTFVSFLVFLITPAYFTLLWWIAGRTLGDALMGFRLCRRNGGRIGFFRAMVRCWLLLLLIPVWMIGTLPTAFTAHRRSWLDKVSGTEALYVGRDLWPDPQRAQPDAA